MAITYVGDASQKQTVGTSTITYTSSASHLLVAAGTWFDSTGATTGVFSITDSAGNTWHVSTSDTQNPPASHESVSSQTVGVFVAWTFQNAGPVTFVDLTANSGINTFQHWDLSEWSGVLANDTGSSGSGTSAGSNLTVPAVTLSGGGELVVSVVNSFTGTMNTPSGGTVFPNDSVPQVFFYEIGPPSGSFAFTYSGFGAGHDYVAATAAFTTTGTNAPAGNSPGTGAGANPASSVKIGMTIRGI